MALRLVFAGTPEFAAAHLQALINSPHEIVAVLTQPDRPAGRGQHLKPSAVKTLALANELPVFQPARLKDEAVQTQLKYFNADLIIIVAYGLILPKEALTIPPLGCINVHASLLPRWRGAAPIQRAIEAGDTETGITIMQMDEGLDTGDMLLQKSYPIDSEISSAELLLNLSQLGAETLIAALNLLEQHNLKSVVQDSSSATYAHKISKAEAELDWNLSAEVLANKVRAFNPWPVAFMQWQNQNCRVWRAIALARQTHHPVGKVIAASKEGIDVQCGKGVLRILELQLPGKKTQSAADFVNAFGSGLHSDPSLAYPSWA